MVTAKITRWAYDTDLDQVAVTASAQGKLLDAAEGLGLSTKIETSRDHEEVNALAFGEVEEIVSLADEMSGYPYNFSLAMTATLISSDEAEATELINHGFWEVEIAE